MQPSYSKDFYGSKRSPFYVLQQIGVEIIPCNQEKQHFNCKSIIKDRDYVRQLILGTYYYSVIYNLDFAQFFSKNSQFSNELHSTNQEKYNLISKLNAIFADMNLNPKQFHQKYTQHQDISTNILYYIFKSNQLTSESLSAYDFFRWFSIFTSISILVINNNKTYHFSNSNPILTLFLKLENEIFYILYPSQYSKELLGNVINSNQPTIEKVLSCGHPYPEIVYKETQNLVEFVLSYTKCPYGCEYLMNEEIKIIYETCKNAHPYSETLCSYCNDSLGNSSVKCTNCQFSYCFQNCKDQLNYEKRYLCAICKTILSPPHKQKKIKKEEKSEDVYVKMYKTYDLPSENLNTRCSHKAEIIFYCNDCKKVSYQYDQQVINNIICHKCGVFFKNSNNLCYFCVYEEYQNSLKIEEENKKINDSMNLDNVPQVVTSSDNPDISNSEDYSQETLRND